MKNLYKSLAVLGVVAVLGLSGTANAGQSLIGEIRAEIKAKVVAAGFEKYLGLIDKELSETSTEVSLGSTQFTSPSRITGGAQSNQDNTYFFGDQGVEIQNSLFVDNTTTIGRLVQGGQVTALTAVATSTLTAAQVCNSSLLTITPVSTTPTITFPSTSTLFAAAGCLTANGQFINLDYRAITTSTIFAAGTGGTALNSSALTVAAGKGAQLRLLRDSATTYLLDVVNLLN